MITSQNVDDSDGTIAIRLHDSSCGTDKTIGYAQVKKWVYGKRGQSRGDGYKPVLVIRSLDLSEVSIPSALSLGYASPKHDPSPITLLVFKRRDLRTSPFTLHFLRPSYCP